MYKNTEFKDEKTFINGKQVSEKWKFVSDGTWYDKDAECVLETDCSWCGGLFRGIRTCQSNSECHIMGEKYEDGELCHWCEFTIYDENGVLVQEAYNG
jgi:hypothetical protein